MFKISKLPKPRRRMWMQLALLVFLTILGASLAYTMTDLRQYRAEKERLGRAASLPIERGYRLGMEASEALRAIASNRVTVCSAEDLDLMRNLVFRSAHVRDAGRLQDGKIVCSAGAGAIRPALAVSPPDLAFEEYQVWVSTWSLTASIKQGFVLQSGDVWVALNQNLLEDAPESPDRFTTSYLYDRRNHRMIKASEPWPPLTMDEIAASRFLGRNGFYYQPLCDARTGLCGLAGERKSAYRARSRNVLWLWTLVGAMLGKAVAAIVFLIDGRRRKLEAQLRRAVRKGRLKLLYQPIVNLQTEEITGAEALIRWTNEEDEAVPPEVFMSLAEAKGFVTRITRLILQCAIQELGDLLAAGRMYLTINITAPDLVDPEFLPELNRMMRAAGIPPSRIGLELTERTTAAHPAATDSVARLKEAGYTLYIDDFGTGYSSLAYLHMLSVDAIKVDRTFTRTVGMEAVTSSVVPQILSMAEQLDLMVVVEGIETREQAEYFRRAGGKIRGQGWLYSKAIPAEELRRLLQAPPAAESRQ